MRTGRGLALLTCITLHLLEAPAAASTTEQERDELQACPQAAALFTPAVPELRGHLPRKGATGMDTGKGQLSLLHIAASSRTFPLEDTKARFVQSAYISLVKN